MPVLPAARPRRPAAPRLQLLALLLVWLLATPRPARADCVTGQLPAFSSACNGWQTIGGAIGPLGRQGYQFHADGGCDLTFSFCQGGGSATFPTYLAIYDSTCTNELAAVAGVCDSLSELTWRAYEGHCVVVVAGVDSAYGSFTLAFHRECPPEAYFHTSGGAYLGHPLQFDATASRKKFGQIVSFAWNFGDGGEGDGDIISHTYGETGYYSPTLTVTDNCGLTATDTHDVRVYDCDAAPPGPPPPAVAPEATSPLCGWPRFFGVDQRVTGLPGSERIGRHALAADTAGFVHLVYGVDRFPPYQDADEGSIYHRAWDPAAGAWGPETLAVAIAGPARARGVAIAADLQRNLHVVWAEGPGNLNLDIKYARRRPDHSWTAPQLLRHLPGTLSSNPVIGADAQGNVYVAWGEGVGFESSAHADVWRADTGQWLGAPLALTDEPNLVVTNIELAIEEDLAPGLEVAHVAWCQAGGQTGGGVMHRMVMMREPSGALVLQGGTDRIDAFSPCALALACSGSGVHFLFDTCFIGAAESSAGSAAPAFGGGPRHVVARTRVATPGALPTLEWRTPEDDPGLAGGVSSGLAVDRVGDLHVILGSSSRLTHHATFSLKDNAWTNGAPVRDVASNYLLDSPLAVDRDGRVHVVWLDHRNPGTDCSGELYADVGVCTPPPAAPTLRVQNVGTGRHLQLDWDVDLNATACRYIVERALTREGVYDSVADVGCPPYLDGGDLVQNTIYSYRVRLASSCGAPGDTSAPVAGVPRIPLVMVHGCCGGDSTAWTNLRLYLSGMPGKPYAIDDIWRVNYDGWGPIVAGSIRLARFISDLKKSYDTRYDLARHGAAVDRVDLVAHSMGGLVSRYYIQRQRGRVRQLITLSSPHEGTDWAIWRGGKAIHHGSEAMDDLSRKRMKIFNRLLRDTPLTGTPWVQCTPPTYFLGGAVGYAGTCLPGIGLELPNDGCVPLSSSLYPGGCEHKTFYGLCHTEVNRDLNQVAPWLAAHLLRDSLAVAAAEMPSLAAALPITPAASADLDSTVAPAYAFVGGHSLAAPASAADTVHVDDVSEASFGLLQFEGRGQFTLVSPLGQAIDSTLAESDPDIDYTDDDGAEGHWRRFRVTNPTPGDWILHTDALATPPAGADFITYAVLASPLRAELRLPDRLFVAGEAVPIVLAVANGAQNLPGCAVTARVQAPDDSVTVLPLFDDGAHADGTAADGLYGSVPYAVPLNGTYHVDATAQGGAGPGGAFVRRAFDLMLTGDQLPPAIRLSYPVGGETLARNAAQSVRWEAWDDTGVDSVRVELSLDDGASYPLRLGVAAGTDSVLAWTAPDTLTTHGRVRVTAYDTAHRTWSDASAASFTLADVAAAPETPSTGALPTLRPPYPNPFRAGTVLEFSLPARVAVQLNVYDVAGRLVRTLVNDQRDPGRYTVTWSGEADNGRRVSSGVYFVRLTAGAARVGRKVLVLK